MHACNVGHEISHSHLFPLPYLFIEEFTASTACTYFFLILQDTVPNAYATFTFTANEHHIRNMQFPLMLNNFALLHLTRGTSMSLDHVDTLDGQTALLWKYAE